MTALLAFVAGVWITRCDFDASGVEVEWDSASATNAPYLCAVYPLSAIQFPHRVRPLAYTLTERRYARLDGDFITRGGSFVQVFASSWTNAWLTPTNQVMVKLPPAPMRGGGRCAFATAAPERRYVIGRDFGGGVEEDRRDWLRKDCTIWLSQCAADRSQCVPVFRTTTSLSAHGGRIVALDRYGCLAYAPAPSNAVPDRIYFKGLETGKEPTE